MKIHEKVLLTLSFVWSLPSVAVILTRRFLPPFFLKGKNVLWTYVYGIPDVYTSERIVGLPTSVFHRDYSISFGDPFRHFTFGIIDGEVMDVTGVATQSGIHLAPFSIINIAILVIAIGFLVKKHR